MRKSAPTSAITIPKNKNARVRQRTREDGLRVCKYYSEIICETGGNVGLNLEGLMRKAARSIVTRSACLKVGAMSSVLIICGRHNSAFAEYLVAECYSEHVSPHLWMWDESVCRGRENCVLKQ